MTADKKKSMILIKIAVALLLIAIIAGSITAVILTGRVLDDTTFLSEKNLLRDTKLAKSGDTYILDVKSKIKINTLAFYEPTNNITDYEVYADGNLIYKQQEMGRFRYATFPVVETEKLEIKVLSHDGDYRINKVEGFFVEREQKDFKVVSYLIADRMFRTSEVVDGNKVYTLKTDFDWQSLDAVTDIILFGYAKFDKNGDLIVNDTLGDAALKALREKTEGRKVNIIINFLGLEDSDTSGAEDWSLPLRTAANKAMGENGEKLKNALLEYVKVHGYDGIDFDYEYPSTKTDWKIFSDFLVGLKESAPENFILSAATQLYNASFSAKAWQSLDYVNVMTYDGWDKFGNHSSFGQCVLDAFYLYNQITSLDRAKINLGLPFYSRPCQLTQAGDQPLRYWGEYSYEYNLADSLGTPLTYWDNYTECINPDKQYYGWNNDTPLPDIARGFNGPQMIKDKTALAYDYGAGGVMVWNHTADIEYASEMSLFRAIGSIFAE